MPKNDQRWGTEATADSSSDPLRTTISVVKIVAAQLVCAREAVDTIYCHLNTSDGDLLEHVDDLLKIASSVDLSLMLSIGHLDEIEKTIKEALVKEEADGRVATH